MMMLVIEGDPGLLLIVALILGLGVASQALADRFQVPSILFLILAGVAVGPKGLGIVTLDVFGDSLSVIVGVSVAIIVFEGAFHLKREKLSKAPYEALRLVTVGAALSFIGTTLAVRYLLGADWSISALAGALLIATGPTVITPILSVVPVRDRVAAAMETEGIVNDVTAAILAVVIFKLLTSQETNPSEYLVEFIERMGVGVFVGLIVGGILWYLLTKVRTSQGWTPQNARLMTLAGAVVAYSIADVVASEAGVAAVATAGVFLGNTNLPYEDEIEEFKGDVTILVLSFVFIALAALIELDTLLDLGIGGLLLVAFVALVIRPLLVFISTTGKRFTRNEKLFVSFVGPRGIIPASVATLFAIRLSSPNPPTNAQGADILAGTVFLVILLTVVFEGGFARQIGEKLDVIPMRVIIIGGGRVGKSLAERLEERGENVVIIEENEEVANELQTDEFSVRVGDGSKVDFLQKSGAEKAKIVVAATGDDDTNLLVAQLARSNFNVDKVIARVNEPDNVEGFNELDVETVSSSMSVALTIDNLIERPAISKWMTELGRSGDVQEIEVTDEALPGMTIKEVNDTLPGGCIIALVSREGENTIPESDFVLEYGDHLTILGRTEAVREALDTLHPHD